MTELNEFRIISNGLAFAIERKARHRFLWLTWEKWHPLGWYELICGGRQQIFHPKRYKTLAEAQEELKEFTDEARRLHEWKPV